MLEAVTIVARRESAHQNQHAQALATGLGSLGIKSTIQGEHAATTSVVACWGWRIGGVLRASGHDVIVMERGYLGDRFAWTSIALNGLNGNATPAFVPCDAGARFRQHFGDSLKPWNPVGSYALIIGQVPGDASLRGMDLRDWYAGQAREVRARYGLRVFFRPHPMAERHGFFPDVPGAPALRGPLDAALDDAALVVTYNSNTGVDALLAGKPVVAFDRGSMAYPVAMHAYPDELGCDESPVRRLWAHDLAWRQWTIPEIESGRALLGVLDQIAGES